MRAGLAREMGLASSRFGPPASETMFVGRAHDLNVLCSALGEGSAVLVQGPGGIGKTELLLKALERRQIGGRVVWLDIEGHRSSEDIAAALAMSSAELEPGESLDRVAGALDDEGCCVVLDGVEQLAETGLDEVDDLLANLRRGMRKGQLVVTSQVDLPRTGFDRKLVLSGLDAGSSRRLLRSLVRGDARLDGASEARLLDFAEGHPLAVRLLAALVEHLGAGRSAVERVEREGSRVVEIPKRAEQNRETSLDKCLSLAYGMLSPEERRLLFVIVNCPGGLFEQQMQHYGGPDATMLAAALRRWCLVQRRDVGVSIDRWYALSPIRSFAARTWREENEDEARALRNTLLRDFGVMAHAIDQQAQGASEVPHMVWRFWLEWRNLQLVIDEAETRPEDAHIRLLVLAVCSSVVRFCFVARLPERGVRMMVRAARIVMRAEKWEEASGYIAEAAGLAQRSDDDRLAGAVEELLEAMPVGRGEAGHLALARAVLANSRGDPEETEKEVRKALRHYEGKQDRARSGGGGDSEVGNRNIMSAAYQVLGDALLARSKPEDAREAYESAQRMAGGTFHAVNEGQLLYQVGRCLSQAGEHEASMGYYARAAAHFQVIGMRGYLANALGQFGHALLELGEADALPELPPGEVLRNGIEDAVASVQWSIISRLRGGAGDSEWAIRKLFGTVVVLSLSGEAEHLGDAGRSLKEWTKEVRDAGGVARRATFEIVHSDALAELMLSIARLEERARGGGSLRESDVDELADRCGSLGILRGSESAAFEWLGLSRQKRWFVREDGVDRNR